MSADLPPEAYTKDTLQAAFDWLQTQPDVVRASIHTPERLVSLYRRAQRLSDNDHPVSSKKFVTELKSLASSLDQFSGHPQSLQATPPTSAANTEPTQEPPKSPPVAEQEPAPPSQAPSPSRMPASVPRLNSTPQTPPVTASSPVMLDALSEARIQEVQKRFNLSSHAECLRLLISLGYEKFTEIP
jgi:hypothetical protein